MDLKQVSSEYILLRESQEFLRRRLSQGRKSVFGSLSPFGGNPLAHGPFSEEDDYQGIRDSHGILVHNDPVDYTTSQLSAGSSKRLQTKDGVITFNPETVVITSDLEVWWVTSPKWRRFIPLFCFFCVIILLAHFVTAITLFAVPDSDDPNPYICDTPNCLRIGDLMRRSMNLKVKPCDNFYQYMCGNYRERDDGSSEEGKAPPELQMWMSSSATFGDEILAKVLRKPESNRVLKFYKSCLDHRSRQKEGLQPFLDLLDEIRITSSTHNLTYIGARLSNFTGDFMLLDYWYGHGLTITVDPMNPILTETIANGLSGTLQDLTHLFSAMAEGVTKIVTATGYVTPGGSIFDGQEAAISVQELCKCVLEIYKNCNQKPDPVMEDVTDDDKTLFDFKKALEIAEEINFTPGKTYLYAKPSDACFLDLDKGQLHKVPACLKKAGFSDARIKFTYRVLWILRVFIAFANDLDDLTFQKILNPQNIPNPTSVLFANALEFRRSWIENQCFKSLAANYGFLAFEAFAKDFETESAIRQIQEYVRREQRILRKWTTLGKFSHLSVKDQELLINSIQPEAALNIIVAEKLYSFSDLESTLRQWEPDPKKYFWNVWTSRRLSEDEMTKDWFFRDTFSPWNTKVATDLLLSVQTTPASRGTTNDKKDFIHVPLTMLTVPFFQHDFRVLNFAGVASFVSREVVRLSLFTTIFPEDEAPNTNSTPNCDCVVNAGSPPTACTSSYAVHDPNQRCYNPSRTNQFESALAIKLAFEAFRHRDEYRTLIPKDPAQSSRIIETSYGNTQGQNITQHRFAYDIENGSIIRNERVDLPHLQFLDPPDLRLSPRWLKGFENFSQEQLFFMQFMRLHCYSQDTNYEVNVNGVISQVQEFSEAWSCPEHSKMRTTKPWFQK